MNKISHKFRKPKDLRIAITFNSTACVYIHVYRYMYI